VVTFLQLLFSQHIDGATFLYSFGAQTQHFSAYFVVTFLFCSPLNSHRPLISLVQCFQDALPSSVCLPVWKKNVFLKKLDGKYLCFKPSKTGEPKHGIDF
jgi:hypothetical protein